MFTFIKNECRKKTYVYFKLNKTLYVDKSRGNNVGSYLSRMNTDEKTINTERKICIRELLKEKKYILIT